ncbi:uncharacterized protein EI97DRAFT_384313 [Westerdykella ornata]|uniref:Oxysterol-binding protein n=1 Tax=Westerdykella ornata TaxID=318751 RepID=A0A6A6JA34_WESOR|nr:uncharacterized protein EI97DRAFT_384313 [Westerdykella ornata]KAF2273117.1 hypothetical protein EI97DRAFT_384313 [Westerdykella ornata]
MQELTLASGSLGNRSSGEELRGDDVTKEDETVVDSEQGSMLMHIISQLRPGADLSRVTLPTFILEPRSMLERITNFMAHPETLLPMTKIEDPVERFVAVVKFYLSGWHIKPPGVKKPLNPILGETFTCYWDYEDGTRGYYIAEQTSHHPPKSSYFFMAPEHHLRIDGTLKPRSKFLGNSAASMMEGIAVMRFLNTNERFFITQPNMYARGILFGKMKYELGDHSFVRCPESGLAADLEFKTKGWVSGGYNAIGGFIKDTKTDTNLFELSGHWNAAMYIKNLTTGKKELLFDATHAKHTPPKTRPLEEQGERESQRLWHEVTEAVKRKDQEVATEAKARIEDRQREEAAKRAQDDVDWHPSLFRPVHGGHGGTEEGEEDLDWIINAKIDGKTPQEQIKQILHIAAILPGQAPPRHQFNIPSRRSSIARSRASLESIRDTHHVGPDPQQQPSQHTPAHNTAAAAPVTIEGSTHPAAHPSSSDTATPEPHNLSLRHEELLKAIPPSKLLHKNKHDEPVQGGDALKRVDSETRSEDEFHDAES